MPGIPGPDLQRRAAMIGARKQDIAHDADLDPNTVGRVLRTNTGLRSTVRKIEIALERREREVLKHLYALHGDPRDAAA